MYYRKDNSRKIMNRYISCDSRVIPHCIRYSFFNELLKCMLLLKYANKR